MQRHIQPKQCGRSPWQEPKDCQEVEHQTCQVLLHPTPPTPDTSCRTTPGRTRHHSTSPHTKSEKDTSSEPNGLTHGSLEDNGGQRQEKGLAKNGRNCVQSVFTTVFIVFGLCPVSESCQIFRKCLFSLCCSFPSVLEGRNTWKKHEKTLEKPAGCCPPTKKVRLLLWPVLHQGSSDPPVRGGSHGKEQELPSLAKARILDTTAPPQRRVDR